MEKFMMYLASVCLSFWLQLCHSQQVSKEFGGPFRIVLYQFEQCEESGTNEISFSSTRISKVSRTKYVYSTNVTAAIPVSDEIEWNSDMAIWGNGGWRPHYLVETLGKFCYSLETFAPELFKELTKSGNLTCPLPIGIYEIKEMDISKAQLSSLLPIMPYGKFRVDVNIVKDGGAIVGCLRGYLDVVPKETKRPNRRKSKSVY